MNPFERWRHIVVEGPIGVGKTSLARRLADRFGAQPMLEEPQANPFLERFYRDSARYALPTQLFFLFQRVQKTIIINTTPTTRPLIDSIIVITIAIFLKMIPTTPTIPIFLIRVVIITIEILDIK